MSVERTVVRTAGVACVVAMLGISGASPRAPIALDTLARQYVRLVLAIGVHDRAFVDMYYGPPEWRQRAVREAMPVHRIREAALVLLDDLHHHRIAHADADASRVRFLEAQVAALARRAEILAGAHLSFDAESRALFDMTAPTLDEASLVPVVTSLDSQLPGTGPVAARLESYSRQLAVPDDRVPRTVAAALAACRERTVAHMPLPAEERVDVVYVRDRPWSAYATYEGGYRTRIEINLDLPRRPDQILDLMCHEGYPGHHTQYSLLEERMVRARGWQEFQVQPLFSPASARSEAVATAGVALAFPDRARRTFEREVLFAAAGVDPSEVARVEAVRTLTDKLAEAGTEAARRYLDGRISRSDAVLWLERYGAMPRPLELLRFIDEFRTYVVGYTAGAELIRSVLRSSSDDSARWRVLEGAIMNVPWRDK